MVILLCRPCRLNEGNILELFFSFKYYVALLLKFPVKEHNLLFLYLFDYSILFFHKGTIGDDGQFAISLLKKDEK